MLPNVSSIDVLTQQFSYERYLRSSNDNKSEIQRMKVFVRKAMENEVTDRQKQCLCEYYLKGKSMKQIAQELNIHPSAVSRHIKRGINNMKKRLIYF